MFDPRAIRGMSTGRRCVMSKLVRFAVNYVTRRVPYFRIPFTSYIARAESNFWDLFRSVIMDAENKCGPRSIIRQGLNSRDPRFIEPRFIGPRFIAARLMTRIEHVVTLGHGFVPAADSSFASFYSRHAHRFMAPLALSLSPKVLGRSPRETLLTYFLTRQVLSRPPADAISCKSFRIPCADFSRIATLYRGTRRFSLSLMTFIFPRTVFPATYIPLQLEMPRFVRRDKPLHHLARQYCRGSSGSKHVSVLSRRYL